MSTRIAGWTLVAAVMIAPLVATQNLASFDAASIKRNVSGTERIDMQRTPGGHFVARNVTVTALMVFAYRVPEDSAELPAPVPTVCVASIFTRLRPTIAATRFGRARSDNGTLLARSRGRARLAAAFGRDRPAAFIENGIALGGALAIVTALR